MQDAMQFYFFANTRGRNTVQIETQHVYAKFIKEVHNKCWLKRTAWKRCTGNMAGVRLNLARQS
jgi:hypothetical protein